MADITMCQNISCPMNWRCHRYTANASESQSYALFQPESLGYCAHFWENDRGREVREMREETTTNVSEVGQDG